MQSVWQRLTCSTTNSPLTAIFRIILLIAVAIASTQKIIAQLHPSTTRHAPNTFPMDFATAQPPLTYQTLAFSLISTVPGSVAMEVIARFAVTTPRQDD
tara:strand:+ start:156 stop:452 length:297 start_codon:yes stop_codon:yes gene_type:complete